MASIDEGSDQVYDHNCTTCLREKNVNAESVKFCLDCKEHFCSPCLKFHQQFSVTKGHTTVDPKRPRAVGVDIGVTGDTRPHVPGITVAYSEDGSTKYYVISDWYNKSVKLADEGMSIVDTLHLKEKPYALSFLGRSKEVAVTLRDPGEIAILKISNRGKLSLVKKHSVSKKCRGMVTFEGSHCSMVFVVSGGDKKTNEKAGEFHLFSYGINKDLWLLQMFKTDYKGENLFPRNVATNRSGDVIYVSATNVGVIAYDINENGRVVWTFSDPKLQRARGLTTDRHGNIYVAGMASANVLKLDASGKLIDEVLTKKGGMEEPISLFYDDTTDRLFIGGSSARDPLQYLQM